MPAPDAPLGHRAGIGGCQRPLERTADPGTRADGVEPAVVRLPHHGIDGADTVVARQSQLVLRQRVAHRPDAQRAREHDRRLEFAELSHLRHAQQLAEAVAHVHRRGNPVAIEVTAVRQDGGHARAQRIALPDRGVSHAHARHVGDGVVRTRRENPRRNAEVAGADARRGLLGAERYDQQRGEHGRRQRGAKRAAGTTRGAQPRLAAGEGCGHIRMMSLRPVFGHQSLRDRLALATRRGTLPASLMLTGPRGVGKQRLALWLAQRLLCEAPSAAASTEPCGECTHCRYASRLQHPDLHWFFPRPRLKDGDASPEEVREDLADAIRDRLEADGLWEGSSGMDGLHVATTRALIHAASLRPALAPRAVFIVGDAERMVPQEGADAAANAFLKLLEEPPPGTTLVLTSSEPGALLPTIRSRVVTLRVAPLAPADVLAFAHDDAIRTRLGSTAGRDDDLVSRAAGAPGRLLEGDASQQAFAAARALLDAAIAPRSPAGDALRAVTSASQGVSKARGAYSDTLDALSVLLHARARDSVAQGAERHARRVVTAISVLERAKLHTQHNVTPMLLTAMLLDDLSLLLAGRP